MKRFFYAMMTAVFLSGCATVYEPYEPVRDPDPAVRRFISLHQLQKGTSRAGAKAVLGNQVVIGYEMPDIQSQRYKPVVADNPYRSEELAKGSRVYVIDYYLTGIQKSDGMVSDDELTPLVFEADALIGWGWDFLNNIKK